MHLNNESIFLRENNLKRYAYLFVCLTVFNATFNNISIISWLSVLSMEEIGGPGENHYQGLSHNVVHIPLIEIPTTIQSRHDGPHTCILKLQNIRLIILLFKSMYRVSTSLLLF